MTSLTVQPQHGTEVERIIAAKQSIEIRQCEPENVLITIKESIFIANQISGQATSAEKINTESLLILDMILRDYPYLSVNEIKVAANLGAYKKFGDYFGINPATFKQWLEGYRLSHEVRKSTRILEEREYAKQKIKTQIDIPNKHEYYSYLCGEGGKRDLHSDESDFKIGYSLQIEFDNHSIGKIVNDPQNTFYDFLDKNNIISFTTEQKNKAVVLAESNQIKIESSTALEDALNAFFCVNLNKSHFLAKCYLLSQYFDECKRNDKNPL